MSTGDEIDRMIRVTISLGSLSSGNATFMLTKCETIDRNLVLRDAFGGACPLFIPRREGKFALRIPIFYWILMALPITPSKLTPANGQGHVP
jgi:hypothetical protein